MPTFGALAQAAEAGSKLLIFKGLVEFAKGLVGGWGRKND